MGGHGGQAYADQVTNALQSRIAAGSVTLTATPLVNPVQYGPKVLPGTSDPLGVSTGQYSNTFVNFSSIADNTDQATIAISVQNVACGAGVRLWVNGTLGDGDSTQTKEYFIAVSRIAGAATGATIAAAVGTATNNGATGNATTTATLAAATGAVTATQVVVINVKVARSAGTSTGHRISAYAECMSGNGGSVTIG